MIERGTKCRFFDGTDPSDTRDGLFLEFSGDEDGYCRILTNDTEKIIVHPRFKTFFVGTFYRQTPACGYCYMMKKAIDEGVCRRGAARLFTHCGTIHEEDL